MKTFISNNVYILRLCTDIEIRLDKKICKYNITLMSRQKNHSTERC